MPYVIDAHALIWHFTNDQKLGANAHDILVEIDAGNERALVPTIVLAEILYAADRGRIPISFEQVRKVTQAQKLSFGRV